MITLTVPEDVVSETEYKQRYYRILPFHLGSYSRLDSVKDGKIETVEHFWLAELGWLKIAAKWEKTDGFIIRFTWYS